ncbi:hypothetical protein [Cupriavidus oxalaticus]|jgi:hypothetical protein|uniref:Uncharacterized protein n=1 Tax=Cupriavidus oxalaticus TaxID=96344 RepID=A0A375GIF2_9BURK|nr:hypothetical protein [Cupriavidus oxalaticus]QRQ85336.1 hypothetical protein JTE91_04475 [Cupriavidus oxalaticus]QRQ90576.1 hypothetical protein JTE92_07870 [Cupriavidus oxalaticus]WQD85097.1 hypothetical protein U0036_25995 [Cupriavidus oxalaticus]SPC24121.1 hypothetical protein CO2235_MP80001 [Cupriavidus oxalaticus]
MSISDEARLLAAANGQGSAAFAVGAFVGEFPPTKNRPFIRLYYVLADIRKLKAYRPN